MLNNKPVVLVAEHNHMIRSLYKGWLEAWGYRVFTATNSNQAVGFLIGNDTIVDIVITDLRMVRPDDGLTVIREGKEIVPKALFVLSTGGVLNDDTFEELVEMEVQFFPKPGPANYLRLLVSWYMEDWHAMQRVAV